MTAKRYSEAEIEQLCFSLSANAPEEMPRPVCWHALRVIEQLRDELAELRLAASKRREIWTDVILVGICGVLFLLPYLVFKWREP